MSTDASPSHPPDAELEKLVAYLDGELDPESGREVERRLAEDEEYRQQLRQLQKSWDMLDHLPQADADAAFTQSTIAMVATKAASGVQQVHDQQTRRTRWRWCVWALSATAACAAGYLLVADVVRRENHKLSEDLPVIQHMDEYRYADNLEFLLMLEGEGLFGNGEIDSDM